MRRWKSLRWTAWLTIILPLTAAGGGDLAAQHAETGPARAWFESTYEAMDVAAEPSELDRLARLWVRATDPGRPAAEREATFRELLDLMIEVQEVPDWRYTDQALDGMAAGVEALEGMEAPPPLVPGETADWGEPGRVEVLGDGPVPLVLISDLDYGGSIYRDFARAHGDRYTSYVVTLPGAAGTPPPPPIGPVTSTPWLDNAQRVVLELVESRGLDRPVVVGVMGSVHTAARLALDHPDRFRAAVLLHGLVRAPTGSPTRAGQLATPEEKRAFADATLPTLFPPDPEATARTYSGLAGASARDSATAERLTAEAMRTDPRILSRYQAELTITDLGDDFADLRVPTLVVPSVHDPRSPFGNTEMGTGQWLSLALDHPEAPLTVVPFRATRNYAPVDRPEELARALGDFLDGEEVAGVPDDPASAAVQPSPAAEVMQVLGATEVRISYSGPGVKGREIWGGLVPWDQVWRAGANAATRISFSEDVIVEGEPLEAGSYAFFVLPSEEGPWRLIFNEVSTQAGSFFHEPRHDALRVEVEPEPAPHREWLRYRIEPSPPAEGRVVLHWADRQVGFHVTAGEDTGLDRIAAHDPEALAELDWTFLARDTVDGARPQAPDGREISWAVLGDTAWFRIGLHNEAQPSGVGVNLVVDEDQDQSTGSPWWGGSSGFTFDRVATVWVVRSGDSYWGTVGVADDQAALVGDYHSLSRGELAFAMGPEQRVLYVGIPTRLLDDDGSLQMIAAVGTNASWNDNLMDDDPADLELRR